MIFEIIRVEQCGIISVTFFTLTAVTAGIKILPVESQFRKGVAFLGLKMFDGLAAFSTGQSVAKCTMLKACVE